MTICVEQPLDFVADGLKLSGVLHLPEHKPMAAIIGCHGLMADKDSPKQIALAKRCTSEGMAYFRFDHRGCGQSEGDFKTQTTVQNRRSDLLAAVDCIDRCIGNLPKGLFGSSLGGTICLTAAQAISPFALVTLAAPVLSRNIRMPADSPESIIQDLSTVRLHFDITKQIESIHHILIIHGSRDQTVALQNAHRIYQSAQQPKRLLVLNDGGHRLSDKSHQRQFMRNAIHWLVDCYQDQFGANRPK